MKIQFAPIIALSFLSSIASAQLGNITAKKTGNLYLQAGYSQSWFSKSDIHLSGSYPDSPSLPDGARGQDYDFTLLRASATDEPEIKSISEWNSASPQYAIRLGYIFHGEYINGVELSFDHFNYVMKPDQTLRVQGQLYDSASQYVKTVEREMLVPDNFVHYAHQNGVNYLMLSFVRGMYLYRNRTETHIISCLVKPGAGVVVPKSEVAVNGILNEDNYHVGGYVAGLECAFRYTAAEQIFIETAGKACYANFSKVLGTSSNSARQTFTSFTWTVSIGYQFRL